MLLSTRGLKKNYLQGVLLLQMLDTFETNKQTWYGIRKYLKIELTTKICEKTTINETKKIVKE